MATIIDSSFLEGSYLPQDTLNNIANKVKIEIGDQIIEIDESLGDSSHPVQNKAIFEKFQELSKEIEEIANNGTGTGTNVTIDTALSDTSENPVQNKVINSALENKQDVITGGASTITNSNLTTNKVLVSDTNGKVAVSAVTSAELGYLDGVTSAIQTQINNKASKDVATTSVNGLMSSTDKTKLDGIETGANKITVDSVLDSTNPVKGEVIKLAIDNVDMKLTPMINSKAPIDHASTNTTYGVGDNNNYGHVKLSDSVSLDANSDYNIAATPSAVKTAYDKAVSAYDLASSLEITKGLTAEDVIDIMGNAFEQLPYSKITLLTCYLTTDVDILDFEGKTVYLQIQASDLEVEQNIDNISNSDGSYSHMLVTKDGQPAVISGNGSNIKVIVKFSEGNAIILMMV